MFQRTFVCLVTKINVIGRMFILGLQKSLPITINKGTNKQKSLYNKLEVGLCSIFSKQIGNTNILKSLLRSEAELKTKSTRLTAIYQSHNVPFVSLCSFFFFLSYKH